MKNNFITISTNSNFPLIKSKHRNFIKLNSENSKTVIKQNLYTIKNRFVLGNKSNSVKFGSKKTELKSISSLLINSQSSKTNNFQIFSPTAIDQPPSQTIPTITTYHSRLPSYNPTQSNNNIFPKTKKKIFRIKSSYINNIEKYNDWLKEIGQFDKEENKGCDKYVLLQKLVKIKGTKQKQKEKSKPVNFRIDVNKKVLQKIILNFNINYDSFAIHKIYTDYIIQKNKRLTKDSKIQKEKTSVFQNLLGVNLDELKDNIDFSLYEEINLLKNIKIAFNERYKLRNLTKYEIEFFKKKENQINYIFDKYQVPNIKNHFWKYERYSSYSNELIESVNNITINVWNYLNIIKPKIQFDKDAGKDEISICDKEKKNEALNKSKKNIYLKLMESEDLVLDDKVDLHDAESYMLDKKELKQKPHVASNELRKIVFEKFIYKK